MINKFTVFVFCIAIITLGAGGCDSPVSTYPDSWSLSCDYVSFEVTPEKLENCATREPGVLTVRPDLLSGILPGSDVQSIHVDGQWLFAINGKTAPALPFDNGADYFQQGLARTSRDGKVGFVNQSLDVVVAPVWDFAFPFEDGFAVVCRGCSTETGGEHQAIVRGGWGYIDLAGNIVVEPTYQRASLPTLSDLYLP